MPLTKKILFITGEGCDDAEVLYPLYRLREAGYEVIIAAASEGSFSAKYHYTFTADITPDGIVPEDYDGLILPGGKAPESLRLIPAVLRAVRKFFDDGKPVGAVCHGPQILISSGNLKNRRCTAAPGIRDDVIMAGGCYEDVKAAEDRRLVTSRRPDDLPAFMREFIRVLGEYSEEHKDEEEEAADEAKA